MINEEEEEKHKELEHLVTGHLFISSHAMRFILILVFASFLGIG
jgi:hypothetical protein